VNRPDERAAAAGAIDPERTRRILVRANNWIGDVVMISPAVRALRRRFPRASIAIVAKRWVLDALSGNPAYDELIEYDHDGLHRGLAGRTRLARRIRGGGTVDLAILFQKAFDAAFLARLAGARIRVGYATDARAFLLTHPLPPPSFHLGEKERSAADAILERRGFGVAPLLIALHPGASKGPRAWHAERFAALAERLRRRHAARFVLIGSAGERETLRIVRAGLPDADWIGPDDAPGLLAAAALLARCHLFVGNDSGPMHLAAALGVPTVGLFGPGRPANTAPRGRPGTVLTIGRDYPCAPCRQDFFRECPPAPSGKPFCLEEIGVDEVERAALRLLGRA